MPSVNSKQENYVIGQVRERRRPIKQWVWWTACLLLASVGLLLVFCLVWWIIRPDSTTARAETVKTFAQIAGGGAFLISLVFTWRSLQESQTANRRREAQTEDAQFSDRFTKAVGQLASEQPEIQIGGIYSLERLSRDSERDYWTIMEVLTAYIRMHASWEKIKDRHATVAPDSSLEFWEPSHEIKAAVAVICRRPHYFGNGEDRPLDLRGTDLRGADFSKAHLGKALFLNAHLEGASFESANLQGASFVSAQLKRAQFLNANLAEAMFFNSLDAKLDQAAVMPSQE